MADEERVHDVNADGTCGTCGLMVRACWCGKEAPPGVAQSERHSEAYDPGARRRIGGQYFDVDDVPPRGDRDY